MTSARVARIVADVKQELDTFMDPALRELAQHEALLSSEESSARGSSMRKMAPSASPDASVEALGRLEAELLCHKAANDRLQAELDDLRHEHDRMTKEMERRATDDAVKAAQLQQERDHLERDGRQKRRRVSEVEGELLLLQREKDALLQQKEDLLEEARAREQQLKAQLKAAEEDAQAQVQSMFQDMCAEQRRADSATVRSAAVADPAEVELLRGKVAELERELEVARLAAQASEPDRALAAELCQQHKAYEEELKEARACKQELQTLRAEVIILKQEDSRLRADLEVRNRVLKESEDMVRNATRVRRDLDSYVQAVTTILEDAAVLQALDEGSRLSDPPSRPGSAASTPQRLLPAMDGPIDFEKLNKEFDSRADDAMSTPRASLEGDGGSRMKDGSSKALEAASPQRSVKPSAVTTPSPTSLSLTWTKLQAALGNLRQQRIELRSELQNSQSRERESRSEAEQLRSQLVATKTRAEELQQDVNLKREELSTVYARLSVHRELTPKAARAPGSEENNDEHLSKQLAISQQQQDELQKRLAQREDALHTLRSELDSEREKTSRLAAAEERAARLAQAHNELLGTLSAQDVEKRQADRRQSAEFSLRQKNAELEGELQELRKELADLGPTGELSNVQREYDRYKRATKRSVQDFREGIYKLLGWKVEMLAEGSTLQMHLTSRYKPGHVLKFQLQKTSPSGLPPEFELLDTDWAKRLMDDGKAMQYLQIFDSVPGFLAHVTCDVVKKVQSVG
mmetsp:Transcript_65381/g.156329  ORF Transcript_65381/g.156329 Transcript_65381/m.156329 type:complete len:750 (-) Transcript_65381:130-2379(-)|eukprot:CAMPEP_0178458190 /NCGR_PEP_ID=MMETSP0689_2-20121128/47419_1 /TAXON_ID=160604 /ORGANISM="Amphidinium massartii, Strain CS-259" /LENGTH=749 /DNA_ID=CAMNT_0020084493 /DNA_START=79 /DNA_END=2328 /DNA_ORIENTATION=+